ncbi:unnamed protein product [Dracunculus medinensis]|uniref:30S ribosomal protein S11 n=1 Tax=Dracunculus medinensis TaxID=318479 RepID=A0A0N4UQV3_DRAME|nr:unnamed protein product [Dracunculus medinensis]
MEGTVGSEQWLSIDTSSIDEHLPTVEIYKQRFNGILFEELPIVYIKVSRNNTIIEGRDYKFNSIMYTSCRLEGFINARKKTSIAGTTTGYGAGQKLLRRGVRTVRVRVRGLGPGRMTSVKGLTMAGIEVVSITDFTCLPELGPRPRKARRL